MTATKISISAFYSKVKFKLYVATNTATVFWAGY
jgi:hypothetical protein